MNAPDLKDLEALHPTGKSVMVNGKEILIKPLLFKQTKILLKVLAKGVEILPKSSTRVSPDGLDIIVVPAPVLSRGDQLVLLANNMNLVSEALSAVTGLSPDALDELTLEDITALALEAYEVNKELFTKGIAALMQKAAE